MVTKKPIMLNKIGELEYEEESEDSVETEKVESDFQLKKSVANVWSDTKELNKDFTTSNLSDQMFNSKIINFIINRMELVKMLRNVYPYAERKIDDKKFILDEYTRERIIRETIAFKRTREAILIKVYTILNLSKARGGLVLKAFLEGGMSKEEMENIAGVEGPAIGEPIKRTWMERLTGRNKAKHKEGEV